MRTCYLSNRSHWVHIDDQMSEIKQTCILVFSQGSVLGPMLFNLYVSDIYKIAFQIQLQWLFSMQMTPTFIKAAVLLILLNPQRVWTLFLKLQVRGLPSHIWRSTPTKTKSMLLSTSRMARVHRLREISLDLKISEEGLERVEQTKLFGVHLQELLKWDQHPKQLVWKSCYGSLSVSRKVFAHFNLRKYLAQALVLSKIDYCESCILTFTACWNTCSDYSSQQQPLPGDDMCGTLACLN